MEATTPLSELNREMPQNDRELPIRKNSKAGFGDEEIGRGQW